jgi:putative RNA 2'-phosphotransferase
MAELSKSQEIRISKFLSLVLRHEPQTINIVLDANGWVDVDELIQKVNKKGIHLDLESLQQVVANNDKKRFAFNEDRSRIRASQGHSVDVELGYEAKQPPEFLYHGTAIQNLDSIRQKGLLKGSRHHVHLSQEPETATKVGSRHGKPVVLTVQSGEMHRAGIAFFQSANGVWLTDTVGASFIHFPA